MSKITLTDIESIPDPLANNTFVLYLNKVAGMTKLIDGLKIKLQTISIPPYGNESFEIRWGGFKKKSHGALDQTQQMNALFIEDSKGETYKTIRDWHEQIVNRQGNSFSSIHEDLCCEAWLQVLDVVGNVSLSYKFTNLYVERVEEVQLDGSQSAGLMVGVSFAFDEMLVAVGSKT